MRAGIDYGEVTRIKTIDEATGEILEDLYKKRLGDDACPFNSLYWNFLDDKKDFFKSNNRMGMMLNLLRKISPEELVAIKTRAYEIIANPDAY